ncbi:MAG: hypothetical protein CFH24_00357 [Alphaproteobacteria bacterium MarineAlpha6_Bin2]|nr:MAG: hypothetical protein CFH24_00357 [Alphaproteobacteria bacterium MarineAlpha6_Bin2]
MKKISFFLLSFFFINTGLLAELPGQEKNPDWPCIQVLLEELSWGSIWTGPPLDERTTKWKENEELRLLAIKIMDRKTKEEDGITELKKFMKKNNSPEDLTFLFHALFDKTNEIWKNRTQKLKNFGKKQRLTSEKIARKLEKSKILLENPEANKEEITRLEQEKFWDIRKFEDRRMQSDYLCEQPRFYEKRLGVYSKIISEKLP